MATEAYAVGPGDLEGPQAPNRGIRRPAAVLAAAALLAVAVVPAVSPTATAGDEATCVPRDDPFDVGLVLDRSESMTGAKIDAARDGAIRLVEELTPNDQSGLVSYASIARVDDPLGYDHASTAEAVSDLQAGGSTATGDAIHASHQDLSENGREGLPGTMIVLTDGITNVGRDPVEQAKEAKADGVEIYAIGVGSNVNTADLKAIASDPVADHYFQVDDADDIVRVFEDLAGVISGEAPYAGEAYAAQAHASSANPTTQAAVHEVAWTSTAGEANATVKEVERTAEGYTVEATVAASRTGGTAGPDEVTSTSTVRLQDLRIRGPSGTLLRADAVSTRAHAWSTPDDAGVTGDGTRLAGLELPGAGPGVAAEATVPPNTEIALPGVGTVTLNEQIPTRDGANATLRVNLVHLEVQGGPSVELVAGSAYAAAACTEATSFGAPGAQPGAFSLETVDEAASAGPATVNPGGCAEDDVAVSATGCSEGDVAVSGTDEARNRRGGDCEAEETCVAASGTGDATNTGDDCDAARACIAASGTGEARNADDDCSGTGTACVAASGTGESSNAEDCTTLGTLCVAASVTGDVDSTDDGCTALSCAAVTGTGDADGIVAATGTGDARGLALGASGTGNALGIAAVSGTGDAVGLVAVTGTGTAHGTLFAAGATGTCNGWTCNDVEPTGPAQGHNTAVSGTDEATARQGAAVSGTGPATAYLGAAVSGDDDATGTVAASGTDEAWGLVAVTGSGSAHGTVLAAGATGTCNGWTCNDVEPTGPAQGHNTAVSGTDEATARQGVAVSGTDAADVHQGVAVSGTDSASAYTGVAVSGCTGVEASFGGETLASRDSPAPVCADPAPPTPSWSPGALP